MAANREALFVGQAGLLDIDVHIVHRPHHTHRLVLQPPCVCVGNQHIAGLHQGSHRTYPVNVRFRIGADLQLKFPVTFVSVTRDLARHGIRRFLRDRSIERKVISIPAAQQFANGLIRDLPEDIPAGDVDGGFCVRVPL